MPLLEVLQYLLPGVKVVITGEPTTANQYNSQVEWHDERPQPKWAEIEAARVAAEISETNATARINRHKAFIAEADPLYFAWQRSEATEQEWLAKCSEIRERFPYA